MEGHINIEAIRALLSQGDTGKATQMLIGLLEKDARYKDNLLRTLRVVEANYNATRQQELKGILSFQDAQREYNKVADTLLAVLDDFEAGRVPPPAAKPSGRRLVRIGAAGGAVVLALLAFWWLRGDRDCPKFENDQALHVIIVPFDKLGGAEARPALRIQDGIQELTAKAGIPAEIKIKTQESKDGFNSQDAEKMGRRCGADLVIFGQYQAYDKDSIRVKMGFRFLKEGGIAANSPFTTFRDITAVQPTRDLQDAVFSLCAMIAIRNRNMQFAKRWMSRIREKNPQETALAEWVDKQK